MLTARQEKVNRHKRSRMRKKQEKQRRQLLQRIDDGEIEILYMDWELGTYRRPGLDGHYMGDLNGEVTAIVIGQGDGKPHQFRRLEDHEALQVILNWGRKNPTPADDDYPPF